jgi:biopolymer transport protein ExbB/TolQ
MTSQLESWMVIVAVVSFGLLTWFLQFQISRAYAKQDERSRKIEDDLNRHRLTDEYLSGVISELRKAIDENALSDRYVRELIEKQVQNQIQAWEIERLKSEKK